MAAPLFLFQGIVIMPVTEEELASWRAENVELAGKLETLLTELEALKAAPPDSMTKAEHAAAVADLKSEISTLRTELQAATAKAAELETKLTPPVPAPPAPPAPPTPKKMVWL